MYHQQQQQLPANDLWPKKKQKKIKKKKIKNKTFLNACVQHSGGIMVRYGAAQRTRAPYDVIDRSGHYIRYIVCCVHHDRHLFYSFFVSFLLLSLFWLKNNLKKNKKTRTLERKKTKILRISFYYFGLLLLCVYMIFSFMKS